MRLATVLIALTNTAFFRAWADAGHEHAAASENPVTFFTHLFGSDFMPHGHCYFWRSDIVWLHVVSNAAIAIAYFSIPLMLMHFIRKRKDLPFQWVFTMFGAFIFWCGTTHILDIVTLWWPVYRLEGVVKAVTASISVLTAFFLFPLIPKALALRSPQELEEKNKELEQAYQKVKESERLKDAFFAQVSHELRTPLTLILAPLETLLSGNSQQLSSSEKQVLKTVHNNAVRLLQMITGLLDMSRFEARKIEVHRESTHIFELTRSVLSDFQPLLSSKRLTASYCPDKTPTYVGMDRYLYERILFNLISNAVKFTPDGGTIQVETLLDQGRLKLSVSDTGIGIEESNIPVLFQRFRQLESTSTRRFEGIGLGLSIVKEFSELLEGSISVKSSPGKGSTFTVHLSAPLTDSTPNPLAHRRSLVAVAPMPHLAAPTEEKKETRLRVLVAEDNAELANYIASLLRPLCEIRLAANGQEAFRLAQDWPADLVLSDVMMPEMDGVELCKALKKNAVTSSVPVVLLTALTHREALLEGWRAGAAEYLYKPFHPTELITRIRSMLTIVEQRKTAEKDLLRRNELQQFAYFASHDLREPLRTLTQMSQMLQRKRAMNLDSETKECLGFIIEASSRMQRIVEDLTAYSLLDSEGLQREPVSLEKVVQEVCAVLKTSIEESSAVITHDPLPVFSANLAQMTRLMQNLISNAIKFRKTEPPQIHISCKKVDREWIVSVKDNGIGFDPAYAQKIFIIFKRLHTRSAFPGTGIGLAICKRIVERLGGRIWAESEPGKGATFHFSVPQSPHDKEVG